MAHDGVETETGASDGTTRRAWLNAVAGGIAVAGGWLLAPERLEHAEAVKGAYGGQLGGRRGKDRRGRDARKRNHRQRRRPKGRDRQEQGGPPRLGLPPGASIEITLSNEGRDLPYQKWHAKAELSDCYNHSEWTPSSGGDELEHRETTQLAPSFLNADQMVVLRVDTTDYFEVTLRDDGDPLLAFGNEALWVQFGGRVDRGTILVDRQPMAENAPATEIKSEKTYLVRRLADAEGRVRFEIQAKGGRISH